MIDARTEALLQSIIRREGRSLLQYVNESFPWITLDETDALAELRRITAEESAAVTELARFLARKRLIPPHLGGYPGSFTGLGFVALDFLLPLLVKHQRQDIARLESDLPWIGDEEPRTQVENMLALKRRHLETLESLANAHPLVAVH